ncbi:MAG: N-acetyl-alpha-D-glucosaminyl L-malate synthase BshA [Gemmatimonadaceae bacterium]|nr:N-acetyl-alpha-D-glucosaminyl L-malate synthase BshA [Gemmatimonadaceae bacterium]
MKIGITCYPTYGGSGALATELGIALAARGHEVHFITYQQPFRLRKFRPRIYFHEVDVGRYPLFEYPPYDLALAVRMHEVVLSHQLELLHVHYAIPHATSAWIAKEMLRKEGSDVPLITTLHGTDITIVGQDPSYQSITRFSIEKSEHVTAVSQYLKDETFRAFGCTGCDVRVIPNFVNPAIFDRARYPDDLRQQVGPGRKIVMHVSNFRPVKRVLDVVRAFARIAASVDSVLVLVGDGPDRDAAEAEARALGVHDRVLTLGRIDAVAPLLANADLLLLPTDVESFGLSALEALASGVPVIGTKAGGLPEVVTHGETGYLFPVGDADAMGRAGAELLLDHTRWAQMSRAAAADVRVRYDEDRIVAQYEALYRVAVGR